MQEVTIDDVAAAAGVSRMTVSRVLRGGHLVRAPLQERVLAAIKQLNYRLNLSARALAGSGPSRISRSSRVSSPFSRGSGATERMLTSFPDCTAIIACNDDMAAAAISVAHRHRLDVPRDLTIVGFDDTPIASIVSPAITTARQPIAEMAQSAIRMLHAASMVADADENKRTQKVLPCTNANRAPRPGANRYRRSPLDRERTADSDFRFVGL